MSVGAPSHYRLEDGRPSGVLQPRQIQSPKLTSPSALRSFLLVSYLKSVTLHVMDERVVLLPWGVGTNPLSHNTACQALSLVHPDPPYDPSHQNNAASPAAKHIDCTDNNRYICGPPKVSHRRMQVLGCTRQKGCANVVIVGQKNNNTDPDFIPFCIELSEQNLRHTHIVFTSSGNYSSALHGIKLSPG